MEPSNAVAILLSMYSASPSMLSYSIPKHAIAQFIYESPIRDILDAANPIAIPENDRHCTRYYIMELTGITNISESPYNQSKTPKQEVAPKEEVIKYIDERDDDNEARRKVDGLYMMQLDNGFRLCEALLYDKCDMSALLKRSPHPKISIIPPFRISYGVLMLRRENWHLLSIEELHLLE